jgi:hypothetical protein
VTDQDQGRDVAVARLKLASRRRDTQILQYDAARGTHDELAAYAKLRAAVDQVAAREAWLAWADRGF